MQQGIFHRESMTTHCLGRLTVALFASVVLASGAAYGAAPSTVGEQPEAGTGESLAVEQTDATTGEKYTVLYDDAGAVVGWMEADGTTYDAHGNLFAKIDGTGNVLGADGSVFFAPDNRKMSWRWGWPPHIRFNRAETRRIDAYGSLAVAPICAAAGGVAAATLTPLTGTAVGVACLAQSGAIIGVARYAVRHNKCAQISVPASVPSTWGC